MWLEFFAVFALAGATTYQFFRGRRTNLELMRTYVRELERALNPIDKTYTLLGLYSGFRVEYLLDRADVYKAEASVALMPRESLLYYPISLLTLKHDRFYLVLRLNKVIKKEIHFVVPKVMSYNARDLKEKLKESITISKKEYLTNAKEFAPLLEGLLSSEEVLHVSLTPSTRVLYVFAKPRPGRVERIVKEALKVVEAL